MLFGRFVPMLAVLAVAGSLAGKRVAPAGPGTMRTDNADVRRAADLRDRRASRALTFFPALLLGPIVQGLTERLF